MRSFSPFIIVLIILALFLITAFAPSEKILGTNARVVYLHGAWVWTSLLAFICAGIAGLAGLIKRSSRLKDLSLYSCRSGLLFWIAYLPLSMWAMKTSWNGLFLAEPRWRLGVAFALGGLLLQVGVVLFNDRNLAAFCNIFFILTLLITLANTQNIMHPPAPMIQSHAWRIQLTFLALLCGTIMLAWQITLGWLRLDYFKRHSNP
jgi:hypothetical protein